jgi:hypothetical protein
MPGVPKTSPWTNHVVAELKRLIAADIYRDMSATTLADKLSDKFDVLITRNAVISQMRRSKIKSVRPPRGIASRRKFAKPQPTKRAKASAINPATQVSIFDHVEGQCRWPVAEVQPISQFRYCGGPVMDDACPYCAAHWRMSSSKNQPAVAA